MGLAGVWEGIGRGMEGERECFGRAIGGEWEEYVRVWEGIDRIEGVWDGYKRGGLEYGRVLEG